MKNASPIGLGCFGIGGPFRNKNGFVFAYGEVSDPESIKTIHKAIEMGVNVYDTADVYGFGRSERVLGEALKEYRDDVIIATKFASLFDEEEKIDLSGKGTSGEYIRNALDRSLARLQTDFIDIYQLHSSNHEIEDTPRVRQILEDLVEEGRIGSFGWSTDDPIRAKIFLESKYCSSIQFALHIANQNIEMIDLLKKYNKVGLIRSPLASGTLSGKYNKDSKIHENHMLSQVDFNDERRVKIQEKIKLARELLMNQGISLVQGLLMWVQEQGDHLIPIPGAKTVMQATENFGILNKSKMSRDLYETLDDLFVESRAQTVAIRK